MGMTLKVLGEYVTLKVKDLAGADVVAGYYKGAVVEGVADDSAQHHIDNGLAEAVSSSEPVAPEEDPDKAPAGNASREAWASYAGGKGATAEELADPADGGLSRDELRELYG